MQGTEASNSEGWSKARMRLLAGRGSLFCLEVPDTVDGCRRNTLVWLRCDSCVALR